MADEADPKPVVNPFIGEEPELPAPPAEAETPPETPPVAEPEPPAPPVEEPGEEDDEPAATEAEGQAPAQAATGTARRRPTWAELKGERRQREALEQQVATQQQQIALYTQQQAQLEAARNALNGQQPQGRAGVDRPYTQQELVALREDDPILYNQMAAEHAQQVAAQSHAQVQQLQRQMVVGNHFDSYRKAAPDFDDALKFLEKHERDAWKATGLPDQQVQAVIEARANAVVEQALMGNKNVAETFYNIAKAYGWAVPAPVVPVPDPAVPANGNGNGAVAAAQARVNESRARSQVEHTSVSGVPGTSSGKPVITRAELARMSEAEMDRLDRESPGWSDRLVE